MYEFRKSGVREEQKQLGIEVSKLDIMIERQRKIVVALNQEIASLDKLEEKKLEEYNDQVNKENEMLISEFITTRLAVSAAS
jgi:flagellar biosynthesis chaperone FliJ